MFTVHFRVMSLSSITWKVWRLRRKSTRFAGCLCITPPTSSSPPMVRAETLANIMPKHSTVSLRITYFLYFFPDKTIKLWKVSERDKRAEGYNLRDEEGRLKDLSTVTTLQVCCISPSVFFSVNTCFLMWVTALSRSLSCGRWISWWRRPHGVFLLTDMHITSTPSVSTVTVKHTCLPTIWELTCGISTSLTAASVSSCVPL